MASVMAIIAKAVFEDLQKAAKKTFAVGDVVALDRYLSAHKGLSGLATGGAMFLVTVRPPDERLWLVAVLESPSFETDKWVSESNAVPIRDVTELIPKLVFSTGKGLVAKPGALGMSLQTPRVLTEADEILLRGAARPSAGAAFAAAMLEAVAGSDDGPPKPPKAKKAKPPAAKKGAAAPTAASSIHHPDGGLSPRKAGPATSWREALVSVETWSAVPQAARKGLIADLVRELAVAHPGLPFKVGSARVGEPNLGSVVHEPSGIELVVVPGGRFAMGFTADDLFALWGAMKIDADDEGLAQFGGEIARARPARSVAVRPFLLARKPTAAASLAEAAGLGPDGDAFAALRQLGWRLPSEAEWEWIAREGGATRFVALPAAKHPLKPTLVPPTREPSGWGFEGLLNENQACADGWHDDHAGAPGDARARDPEQGPDVSRSGHTWWQDHAEAIALLAGYRLRGRGLIRLALDLPGVALPSEEDVPAIDWATTFRGALAALTSSSKVDRERGRRALAGLAIHPAEDADAFAAAVAPGIGDLDAKQAPSVLRLLGDLAATRAAASQALASHTAALVARLADGDAKVRSAAAYALAHAPSDDARRALAARVAIEKKAEPLASALLALARVAKALGVAAPELDAKPKASGPLVETAVLLAQADLRGATDAHVIALAGALALEPVDREALPWSNGDLGAWAYRFVEAAGPAAKAIAARGLVARAKVTDTRGPLMLAAMRLAFGAPSVVADRWQRRVPEADALTPLQREIVTSLSERAMPSWPRAFEPYAIPEDLESRRGWLGLQHGMSDRPTTVEVRGEPRTMPLWRFREELKSRGLAARFDRERWLAEQEKGIGHLGPVERFALMIEYRRADFLWDDDGDGMLAPALEADRAATRAAAREQADRGLALIALGDDDQRWRAFHVCRALVATLEPGETLDPRYAPLLRPLQEKDVIATTIEAMAPADREGAIATLLAPLEARIRAENRFLLGADHVLERYAPLLALSPTASVARAIMRIGTAGALFPAAQKELAKQAGASPEVAAVLASLAPWGTPMALPECRAFVTAF